MHYDPYSARALETSNKPLPNDEDWPIGVTIALMSAIFPPVYAVLYNLNISTVCV